MKKRIISIILAVAMVSAMLPFVTVSTGAATVELVIKNTGNIYPISGNEAAVEDIIALELIRKVRYTFEITGFDCGEDPSKPCSGSCIAVIVQGAAYTSHWKQIDLCYDKQKVVEIDLIADGWPKMNGEDFDDYLKVGAAFWGWSAGNTAVCKIDIIGENDAILDLGQSVAQEVCPDCKRNTCECPPCDCDLCGCTECFVDGKCNKCGCTECFVDGKCGDTDCEVCYPPCKMHNFGLTPVCGETVCLNYCEALFYCRTAECETCKDVLCDCLNCDLCGFKGGQYGFGKVLGKDKVTIEDAVAILCFLAKLPSVIGNDSNALAASLITEKSIGKNAPVIGDAVQILCYLAKLPSRFDTLNAV